VSTLTSQNQFARPVLKHLRQLVHQACPEIDETIKWSMPAFVHKGLLCMMAAFKQHATFHFWRHQLVVGNTEQKDAMGEFGRITSLKELPGIESCAASSSLVGSTG